MSNREKFLVGSLISYGGILLAVVSVRQEFEKYVDIPNWLAIVLISVGIFCVVLAALIPLFSFIKDYLSKEVWFHCRNITEDEIDWMLKFVSKIIPDLAPTREKAI